MRAHKALGGAIELLGRFSVDIAAKLSAEPSDARSIVRVYPDYVLSPVDKNLNGSIGFHGLWVAASAYLTTLVCDPVTYFRHI